MPEIAGRLWRVVAAALCFAGAGMVAAVLGWLILPLLHLGVRDGRRRRDLARRAIRQAFRALVGGLRLTGLVSYEIQGRHLLHRRGMVVLANHPTLLDVVFLLALVEQADCVVKAALARNFFLGGAVRAAGFVFNDSGAGLPDACVASVGSGANLVMFPEGTRTPASGALHLRRGAAHVALQGRFDILPVCITCTPVILGKHQKWHGVARERAHFRIRFCEPIATAPFAQPSRPALAARRLTAHLTARFALEIRRADT